MSRGKNLLSEAVSITTVMAATNLENVTRSNSVPALYKFTFNPAVTPASEMGGEKTQPREQKSDDIELDKHKACQSFMLATLAIQNPSEAGSGDMGIRLQDIYSQQRGRSLRIPAWIRSTKTRFLKIPSARTDTIA